MKCVSKAIMSPSTAKLKCPHGNEEHTDEAKVDSTEILILALLISEISVLFQKSLKGS